MTGIVNSDNEYATWLADLKQRVRESQTRAIAAANTELVMLYWTIGRDILERQDKQGWGSKVVDRLASDLKREFPDMKGYSRSNLMNMRNFAEAWSNKLIVQTVSGQLSWSHNVTLLTKLKDNREREWYARATIQNGWSLNVMAMQIDTQLHKRQGTVIGNFSRTLPLPQSELVQQTFKDPYVFDFLTIAHDAVERDVEIGLIKHISNFMLELGRGFAYMGRQYPLRIGHQDFALDPLFYNVNLNCYVIIDLKMDEFKPEYAGKMQFYLNVLEDTHKSPTGAMPVGIILCRSKNNVVVEYALKDSNRATGVSEYTVTQAPPPQLLSVLPSAEELGMEITAAEASLEPREAENTPGLLISANDRTCNVCNENPCICGSGGQQPPAKKSHRPQ